MAEPQAIEPLQARKLALLAQSEANRCCLKQECDGLRDLASVVDAGASCIQQARGWWPLAAPLLGLLAVRHGRRIYRLSRRLAAAWPIAWSLYAAWRQRRRSEGTPQSTTL